MAKISIEEIVSALSEMTLMEVSDLVKAVEEKFGVSAAAPVAVAAAGGAAASEEAAGPSEVSVILKSPGANKIAIFKLVKDLTGLGLLEAKKLVESAPVAIKENIAPADAQDLKAKLVEAGAEVEIK